MQTAADDLKAGASDAQHSHAIIDIGSNSVRLVIYRAGATTLDAPLVNEKAIVQLGRGLAKTGALEQDRIDAALSVFSRFKFLVDAADVTDMIIVATEAVRAASNAQVFIQELEAMFGVAVEVISGAMEGNYAAIAVAASIPRASGLVVDLGGGSLELATLKRAVGAPTTSLHSLPSAEVNGEPASVPLGTLRLLDKSAKSAEVDLVDLVNNELLAEIAPYDLPQKQRKLFAVGGAFRALATLSIANAEYPLRVIHGYRVSAKALAKLCRRIIAKKKRITKIAGILQSRRQETIAQTAALMLALIKRFQTKSVTFSTAGLREGVLVASGRLINPMQQPITKTIEQTFGGRTRFAELEDRLFDWTGALFKKKRRRPRLQHLACQLADQRWNAHPSYRALESATLVLHSNRLPLTHQGRAFVAAILFARYGGDDLEELQPKLGRLLTKKQRREASVLGAALALAMTISSGVPGLLHQSKLKQIGDRWVLTLPDTWQATDISTIESKAEKLSMRLGSPVEIAYGAPV